MGIYALFYIYRPAKFGVAVFKASMLSWLGGQSDMVICALFHIYIDLPSLVQWYSRHLCLIDWGSICHRYMCIVLPLDVPSLV